MFPADETVQGPEISEKKLIIFQVLKIICIKFYRSTCREGAKGCGGRKVEEIRKRSPFGSVCTSGKHYSSSEILMYVNMQYAHIHTCILYTNTPRQMVWVPFEGHLHSSMVRGRRPEIIVIIIIKMVKNAHPFCPIEALSAISYASRLRCNQPWMECWIISH